MAKSPCLLPCPGMCSLPVLVEAEEILAACCMLVFGLQTGRAGTVCVSREETAQGMSCTINYSKQHSAVMLS